MSNPPGTPESVLSKALRAEAEKDFDQRAARVSLNVAADEIDRQAIIIAAFPVNEVAYLKVCRELEEMKGLLNRREITFQKEHEENRQLLIAVDKAPKDGLTMQGLLPGLMKSLLDNKGLKLEDVLAEVTKVETPEDVQAMLAKFMVPLMKGIEKGQQEKVEEQNNGEKTEPDKEPGRLGAADAGEDADVPSGAGAAVPDGQTVSDDDRAGNGHDDQTGARE